MSNFLSLRETNSIVKSKSIDALIDTFISSQDVKTSSKDTYRKSLKQFLLYSTERNLQDPTREDILNYKTYLLNDKKLSPTTLTSYLVAVRKFFEWGESEKLYPNIAKSIKGAKRPKGFRKDVLTVAQIKDILSNIDRSDLEGKRDYAIINLLVRTGLRTIEIQRALIEDLRQEGGEAVLFIQGKGRDLKDDFVLLTNETLKPIREYLKERGKVGEKDSLFSSHSNKNKGEGLTTRSLRRIVKERLKEIGIDDGRLSAHSLRHTAITLSLLGGATLQEARTLARHSDINTTLIYAQNISRVNNAPERKIDNMLN
jgi:integrase/recombinase XerC/integrase/recombinase XerD